MPQSKLAVKSKAQLRLVASFSRFLSALITSAQWVAFLYFLLHALPPGCFPKAPARRLLSPVSCEWQGFCPLPQLEEKLTRWLQSTSKKTSGFPRETPGLLLQQVCCKGLEGVTLQHSVLLQLCCRGLLFHRQGEEEALFSTLFLPPSFLFSSLPKVAPNHLCAFQQQQR